MRGVVRCRQKVQTSRRLFMGKTVDKRKSVRFSETVCKIDPSLHHALKLWCVANKIGITFVLEKAAYDIVTGRYDPTT